MYLFLMTGGAAPQAIQGEENRRVRRRQLQAAGLHQVLPRSGWKQVQQPRGTSQQILHGTYPFIVCCDVLLYNWYFLQAFNFCSSHDSAK